MYWCLIFFSFSFLSLFLFVYFLHSYFRSGANFCKVHDLSTLLSIYFQFQKYFSLLSTIDPATRNCFWCSRL
ncbi:hypothetical protein BDV23DRAFT_156451 [Aspergillus alliaceus]|uniref:Uncharacterized protein n=1 Tax=Petromyces alliaceus TaxID=209559 RepID=A0A5N7C731_PETAA|nr:hypothetical protein BDV23DRAFT_156451 [Aspergillus alliaceus]